MLRSISAKNVLVAALTAVFIAGVLALSGCACSSNQPQSSTSASSGDVMYTVPYVVSLKQADARLIKMIFGLVIVCVGIEMLLRERNHRVVKQSKPLLILIGIVSGVLCGLYGIGALLAAYVGRVTDNSKEFKANICIVFIVENTFRMIMYACTGILNLQVIRQAVVLVPFMLIGLLVGMKSGKVLDERVVKKLVIIMLILSGVALVANNW